MKYMKTRRTIYPTPAVDKAISNLAKQQDRSYNYTVNQVLEAGLAALRQEWTQTKGALPSIPKGKKSVKAQWKEECAEEFGE